MTDDPELRAEIAEEQYTKLCDETSLHLRLNRMAMAEAAVAKLLEQWPKRTTALERAGDLAMVKGNAAQARTYYKQALEIEPANGDAERKYGLALLTLTPDERRRGLIDAVMSDSATVRPSPRKPLNALMNGLIFPGLGQLYNREHEKGLALVAAGGLLLMLIFHVFIQVPYSHVAKSVGGARVPLHQQLADVQDAMQQMSGGYWLLAVLLVLVYVALYAYGIYDAWQQAQSETEKDLGVL